MLVYSAIYLLLAIYVERLNPGEFGVSQSWNYICKRSNWRKQSTAVIRPIEDESQQTAEPVSRWIETNPGPSRTDKPSVVISHLTKVCQPSTALSLSLPIDEKEHRVMDHFSQ